MSQFINNPEHTFGFDTLQLHVGQESADPASDSRAVPIYQTTSYVFRNSQHAADRFGLADAGRCLTKNPGAAFVVGAFSSAAALWSSV